MKTLANNIALTIHGKTELGTMATEGPWQPERARADERGRSGPTLPRRAAGEQSAVRSSERVVDEG